MNTSNSTFLLHEAFKSTGYLIVNKTLLKKFELSLAVQLCYYIDRSLYFYQKYPRNRGWFFCTHKEVVEVLGIKEYSVRKNKNTLKEMGILQIKTRGMPAKEWMKINTDVLLEFVGQDLLSTKGQDPLPTVGHIYKKTLNNKTSNNSNIDPQKMLEHFPTSYQQDDFILHRKQIKKPLTPITLKRLCRKLRKYDLPTCTEALSLSVENGWTGVFPESIKKSGSNNESGSHHFQSALTYPEGEPFDPTSDD